MAFGFQGPSHAGGDLTGPYIPSKPGEQYDPTAYGSWRGYVTNNPDGGQSTDYQRNAAADATARYQGMGAHTYNAPQLDTSQIDQSRDYQRVGMDQMAAAMYGTQPSRAELLERRANEGAIAGTMSTAASIKGGPGARIAALRGAQVTAAGQEAAGNRDVGALRADEIARAREGFLAGATGMRGQDIGQAGANAQLQAQTNALNEGRGEFYEGLGNKVQEDQLNANLGFKNADTNAWGTERAAKLQDEAQDDKRTGAILGGVAGGIGSISDIRAKDDVYPVSGGGGIVRDNPYGGNDILRDNPYGTGAPAPSAQSDGASARSPFFDALSGIGAGMRNAGSMLGGASIDPGAAYMPMPIRSDARAKYIVSDDRAKLVEAFRAGQNFGNAQGSGASGADAPSYVPASHEPTPRRTLEVKGPQTGPVMTRSQPWQGNDDPMAEANRSYEPSAYHYKPGFGEDPNRPNVGPMAQNMAANPVAATAVVRDPQTGLLAIDQKNATKLALGGLASTQAQIDEQRAEIERLRRQRGQSEEYIPRRAAGGRR